LIFILWKLKKNFSEKGSINLLALNQDNVHHCLTDKIIGQKNQVCFNRNHHESTVVKLIEKAFLRGGLRSKNKYYIGFVLEKFILMYM
jgi:hypothetical protein